MELEKQVREAIVAELARQASLRTRNLAVEAKDRKVEISGSVDLDELVMAVIGSVAGGP